MFDVAKIRSIKQWPFIDGNFAFELISLDIMYLRTLILPNTSGYSINVCEISNKSKTEYRRVFKTTDTDVITLVKLMIDV